MAIDPKFERCLEAYLTREHNLKWGGYGEAITTRSRSPPEERARKNPLDFYRLLQRRRSQHGAPVGCTDYSSSRAVIYAIEAAPEAAHAPSTAAPTPTPSSSSSSPSPTPKNI
jgi:hypothetical protein